MPAATMTTAEWFKGITDVLADQLFALQLIRLRAAECGISVTTLLEKDRTCDGTFLALSELQECRQKLITTFDDCPVKFKWNVLYCLGAIDVLIVEVFVDDDHPVRRDLANEMRTQAANTRDLDALVAERLLFDFFWRSDADLLATLKTAVTSACILSTQRSLPQGTVFAPIPCVQCRFDHAFSPETDLLQLTCTHLASSLAPPVPADVDSFVPDLPPPISLPSSRNPDTNTPTTTTTTSTSTTITTSRAGQFPTSDGVFDHLATTDRLNEIMTSWRSSSTTTAVKGQDPITPSAVAAAQSQLMTSRAWRDHRVKRDELAEIRSALQDVITRRREATACKAINEWMLLRLVDIIDALARRLGRSHRVRALPSLDDCDSAHRSACDRLQRNLRGMVLQDKDSRQLCDAFNDLALDPLTRDRQRIFRPYIDSRKLMYAVGIAPADILEYDRSVADITNRTVFELRPRHARDRFFKAVFVSGLFCLYLKSIGCEAKCVPTLYRADDRMNRDGFCFSVDGSGIVAIMNGQDVARVTDQNVLSLCIAWIRALLATHAAGEATDSLTHLLSTTI